MLSVNTNMTGLTMAEMNSTRSLNQHLAPSDFDTITSAKVEDSFNRHKLRGLYLRTAECIHNLPSVFQDSLEQFFPQYETRMRNYIEELKSSHCVLLVAGEMGCGKSSLVNLLLGVDLMPTSNLQCTATIVEISYGSSPQAVFHYRVNGSGRTPSPVTLTPDRTKSIATFLERVQTSIVRRDEETDESPFEKIQLLWPLDMLQGGMTIVDSPGVGGADGLPQVLSSYLEKAFGFIYVIDITVDIHLHRLGQLLLKTMEANDGFDPSTILFVCNRLDKVQPENAELKVKSTIARLDMFLPPDSKVQIYPISVKQSAIDVKYGRITTEHRQLVDGIRTFLPQTMRGKLRIYYRYMSSLLKRVILSLRITFDINKEVVEKIRKQYTEVEKRLAVLQKNPKKQLDMIRRKVETASATASTNILTHLSSMFIRTRLSDWNHLERPQKVKSWSDVLKNANAAIAERVAEVINSWEREHTFVKSLEDDVIKLFKEQFHLFDEQLGEIQGALLKENEMIKSVMMASNNYARKKRFKKRNKIAEESFLSIGAAVVASFNLDSKDPETKEVFKNKFFNNPCGAMMDATRIYLNMMDVNTVAGAINTYFDRHIHGIDHIGSSLPDMVKNDKNLLVKLSADIQRGEIKLFQIPEKEWKFSLMQGDLDLYYVQRLIVPDFTSDQLIYEECLGSGCFANVYKGILRQGDVDVQVAVKEPDKALTREEVTDVLLEEFMLRNLNHSNIIRYYGMTKKGTDDDLRLIFVMEYCPHTLKEICVDVENSPSSLGKNPFLQMKAIRTMTKYLRETCSGLTYLHHKSIVHRDLKPENILLSTEGVAKIADLGLAIKVVQIVTSSSGTPIFMAPEALLRTEKSNTKVDIYSFGMVMWEIWYGKDLATYASSDISGSLENAILAGWRPSLTSIACPTTFWAELMKQCWNHDPKLRPTAAEIARKLEEYDAEIARKMKEYDPELDN